MPSPATAARLVSQLLVGQQTAAEGNLLALVEVLALLKALKPDDVRSMPLPMADRQAFVEALRPLVGTTLRLLLEGAASGTVIPGKSLNSTVDGAVSRLRNLYAAVGLDFSKPQG